MEDDDLELWRIKAHSITKYLPELYNEQGHYTTDEWTSRSDIGKGKSQDGSILTAEEYQRVEDAYVIAVKVYMSFFKAEEFRILMLYKISDKHDFIRYDCLDLYPFFTELDKEATYIADDVDSVVRLALREDIQVTIEVDKLTNSHVHFGYDYYMYFVSDTDISILRPQIESVGLFMR